MGAEPALVPTRTPKNRQRPTGARPEKEVLPETSWNLRELQSLLHDTLGYPKRNLTAAAKKHPPLLDRTIEAFGICQQRLASILNCTQQNSYRVAFN